MKKFTLVSLLFLLISCNISFGQEKEPGLSPLAHTMSRAEELRKDEIGRSFIPTDPPSHPVRMVAEFEEMQSVLIRYPFGIPMTLIKDMADDCNVITIVASSAQQQSVLNSYITSGVDTSNCDFMIAPTDSYWTRDYGPWFVVDSSYEVGICDFPYNRPRPNDDNIPVVLASYLNIPLYGMNLISTGGNWMCDGLGKAASTDLIWDENPSMPHAAIDTMVSDYLGVQKYNVLPDPLGEYIKHIDCWGKFLDVDKVLIGQVPANDPRYSDFEYVANYFALQTSSWGDTYKVYRVYTPGNSPYTPYTNSLILNKKVFVPITGSQYDQDALDVYEQAMPGYEVIGIMYNTWENTDALHCRTKGVADLGMLYVKHSPLLGNRAFRLNWDLFVDIIPYSGAGLIQDSLKIYYMVDSTAYLSVPLSFQSGHTYKATIPFQEPGSQIEYYVHTADYSGRIKDHPFIGRPDPHKFTVNYATDAVINPDTLVYLTLDEMFEGKTFNIYNYTNDDLTIQNIENTGNNLIYWYIDPWNIDPPLVMNYGDSLTLNVKIDVPVGDQVLGLLVDTLHITTQYGIKNVIIKADESLLSAVSDTKPNSSEGIRLNVFPNPISSTTRISLTLDQAGPVKAEIFSLQGQKLQSLVDGNLSAGKHEYSWDTGKLKGNSLTEGIYLLKVRSGKTSLSKKLIIIR